MEARSRAQWIVAVFLGLGALSFPVFADEVYKYEGEFNLQIPADPDSGKGWMADAVIEIDYHLTILDLDVGITLTHSNIFDLQISLQSPDGTTLSLNAYNPDNEFFQGADYSQTIFDDEAQTSISQAQPPFTGRFRPDAGNLLEIFDGQDAYGPWQLQIYDAYYHDTGTLDSFELTITTPEPATMVLLALGAGCAALFRPRRRQ
jgi:subtilisin-like proprotein convertase family protein